MPASARDKWREFKKLTDFEDARVKKMDVGPLLDAIAAKTAETQKRYKMVQGRTDEILDALSKLGEAFKANAAAMQAAPGTDAASKKKAKDDFDKLRAAIRKDMLDILKPINAGTLPDKYDIHELKVK